MRPKAENLKKGYCALLLSIARCYDRRGVKLKMVDNNKRIYPEKNYYPEFAVKFEDGKVFYTS